MSELTAKLTEVEAQYDELNAQLATPEVATDQTHYQQLAKEQARLQPIVEKFHAYQDTEDALRQATELLEETDADLRALAEEEIPVHEVRLDELTAELNTLLLPADPDADRNVILEIRAGTGGDEAAIFSGDLYRMYSRYAEERGWRIDPITVHECSAGGYKELIVTVVGRGAFAQLKHESGVHRVQRVPVTESSGRIHTSAATVAVLPEAQAVDIEIDMSEVEIQTFKSGGAGGQNVQKNDTAVRLTHKPTGLVVICQDERSQLQNREKALRVLRSRLLDMERQQKDEERASARRDQVRSGDRSEKIRTYNFPQNRATDHRIGLTLHQLDQVMEGRLQPIIDALTQHEREERLRTDGAAAERGH